MIGWKIDPHYLARFRVPRYPIDTVNRLDHTVAKGIFRSIRNIMIKYGDCENDVTVERAVDMIASKAQYSSIQPSCHPRPRRIMRLIRQETPTGQYSKTRRHQAGALHPIGQTAFLIGCHDCCKKSFMSGTAVWRESIYAPVMHGKRGNAGWYEQRPRSGGTKSRNGLEGRSTN